jgi:hypothetical protein
LTATLEHMLSDHTRPRSAGPLPWFSIAEKLAGAESHAGRVVGTPAANVLRVGREAYRELLAGARLVAGDSRARRLLLDYLRSTETREHVSPRQALGDLLRLGALRRAKAGRFDATPPYDVSVRVDEAQRRVVLRSSVSESGQSGPPPELLAALLREQGWEFVWDHSAVGGDLSYPLARSHVLRLEVPPEGASLPTLNWLARYRPDDVVAALEPVLSRSDASST